MVVRIRLQRFGQKNLPFYRMVVADGRSPRDGRFIERVSFYNYRLFQYLVPNLQVGTYNPIADKTGCKEITANSERIRYWISVGAQPSDRVGWLLGKVGIIPPPPVRESANHGIPKIVVKARKEAAEKAAKAAKAK